MDIQVRETSAYGPVYQQISTQISELIKTGKLASGESLPSPAHVARQCNVDRGEVSRAYFELEQGGLIVSKKSKNFLGETSTTYSVL